MKQISGMYLLLVAVLVGVHTVVEPLYHVSTEAQPYDETVSLLWIVIDAILPLVTGAMGIHLVRGSRGGG